MFDGHGDAGRKPLALLHGELLLHVLSKHAVLVFLFSVAFLGDLLHVFVVNAALSFFNAPPLGALLLVLPETERVGSCDFAEVEHETRRRLDEIHVRRHLLLDAEELAAVPLLLLRALLQCAPLLRYPRVALALGWLQR